MGSEARRFPHEFRLLSELSPYARNARLHSASQVRQIAASIREFGFTNPVLIDESGQIIAGHGRVLGALEAGLTEAPCIVLAGLTEQQRRAYVIADNKIALNSTWDEAMLAEELGALSAEGLDLSLVGFSSDELLALTAKDTRQTRDPDAAPPVPDVPVSGSGDVWILGDHRVLCGDCTAAGVMGALLRGDLVDCVWTDPPYNVNYGDKANFLNGGGAGKGHRITKPILNDSMPAKDFADFLARMYGAVFDVMRPGAAIYVAHSETERASFTGQFTAAGFKLSGVVIWRKDALVLGRNDYQWIHEPILYGWKPGAAHRWVGGRKQTTIAELDNTPFTRLEDGRWQIAIGDQILIVDGSAQVEEVLSSVVTEPRPRRNDLHPTMKPVALIERMLRNSAPPGAVVLDPFGGSGSTLMAAERLAMRARLTELDPLYVDVIVRRWQEYTGKRATLEATGMAFDDCHELLKAA